jgi:hypothetical protein
VNLVAINFAEDAKWSSTLRDGLSHRKKIAESLAFSLTHPMLKTTEPMKPQKTGFLDEKKVA